MFGSMHVYRNCQSILLRELHLGQEFLEAGIGVDGIESGILTKPVHATSALICLIQPLKCTIFFPQLRIDAGDFIGTNVAAKRPVPSRRRALVTRNFIELPEYAVRISAS